MIPIPAPPEHRKMRVIQRVIGDEVSFCVHPDEQVRTLTRVGTDDKKSGLNAELTQ